VYASFKDLLDGAQVLKVKELEFILAAESLGAATCSTRRTW
jgi:hypothetical protein